MNIIVYHKCLLDDDATKHISRRYSIHNDNIVMIRLEYIQTTR